MSVCVVADTGPLIALAGSGQLGLLRAAYTRVVVPEAVHDELLEGGAFALGVAAYQRATWIEVMAAAPEPSLLALLGRGEASVITLGVSLKADCVLIDEQKARKIASSVYNLTVMGTVRVLLDAKREKRLASVKDALEGMLTNGYRLHEAIVEYALKEAGETEE